MTYNFLEQHIQWQKLRCGKFTASEIHKLFQKGKKKDDYFGQGAMTYIKTKLAELLTGEVAEFDNNATEWGNSLELEAVLEFEKVTGLKVDYFGKGNPQFINYNDYAGGSPDGLVGEDAIIEIKAPYNSKYHIEHLLLTSGVDLLTEFLDKYCQLQMNLLCTKREKAYFVSYDPRMIDPNLKLKILEVYRDEEMIEEMKERIDEATKQLKVLEDCVNGVIA